MGKITSDYIRLKKIANNPPQPPSGEVYLFAKSNGKISLLDDTNTEVNMTGNANALNDLSDVTITAASEGEYLSYSGGAFVDTAFPTIPTLFSDFTDVDVSDGLDDDIVIYYSGAFASRVLKPSMYAYTTSSLSLSSSATNTLMPVNSASVTRVGNTGELEGTNYFARQNSDITDDGMYLLETWFEFSSASSGNVTITPVTVTGSTPTLPDGGSVTDPYITVTINSSFISRVYVQYAFHPPHADDQHTWMFDNGIAATVNYDYRSTFRKFGHNMSNTALFDVA